MIMRVSPLRSSRSCSERGRRIASEVFHPYVKYKAPTELSKKKMELRIYRGKAFADFSPSFIKEFVMPLICGQGNG